MAGCEVLTTAEMGRADTLAVAAGVPSLTLMENAGRAVADEAAKRVPAGARIAVLCGPGNNGGDGFVAARLLAERGYEVRLGLLGDRANLKGDAAAMASRWAGAVADSPAACIDGADLVVDALFGAGLSRALDGEAAQLVAGMNASGKPILAVDVPSGLDGTTGAAAGPVVKATRTVTFFRKKPGHLLMPGRALCGEIIVADIGIPAGVLCPPPVHAEHGSAMTSGRSGGGDGRPAADDGNPPTPYPSPRGGGETWIDIRTWENRPELWRSGFPRLAVDGHKYSRGHALVVSGPAHATGAARMGARSALRIGAGLVTVASPREAVLVNAAHLTAIMLLPFEGGEGLAGILADTRKNAVLIGPGCGVGPATRTLVARVLAAPAAAVLDADAITSFAGDALSLAALIKARAAATVITPHEGELQRLTGGMPGAKLERARRTATVGGCVTILKGPDTVVAAPDGRAAINANAPPWLATAGSGDVLAGFVTGLLAQGMPAFEAACAAVWLHGECANAFGQGLIAEDLPEVLPRVLARLATQL
jgi:NAD(P)H-hydrate epimerase